MREALAPTPPPPTLAQVAPGLYSGMLIKISFGKKKKVFCCLEKKSLKSSGLFQNPQLEVIHLECLDLEAYAHFKYKSPPQKRTSLD